MEIPKSKINEQVRIWEQRRDLIYTGLKELGFDLWKPKSSHL